MTPTDDAGHARWADIFRGRLGVYTLVLNLGVLLFAINQFVVATIMPSVVGDLGGLRFYAWSFSLFAAGSIVGAAASGPMRATFGARRAYAGAGALMAVGLAGAALAPDMLSFVGWRIVQGLGGGAVAAQAYGLVATVYPPRLHGRILAFTSTVWGVATVAGPGVGGVFAELGYWQGAFWGMLPVALIFIALAWTFVVDTERTGTLKAIPIIRLGLLAGAVVAMSVTSLTDDNVLRAALIGLGLGVAAIAFRRDAMAKVTMFPRKAAAIASELGACYWMMLFSTIVMTFFNTYTPLYLQVLHGISPLIAGYIVALPSFSWTFGALMVATWHGRMEVAGMIAGMALIVAGALGVALFAVSGPVVVIAGSMVLVGFGIGMMNNPAVQRAIATSPPDEKHVAAASAQTVRTFGVSLGAAACGFVAAVAGLTQDAAAPTVAHAVEWIYGVNVAFALAGLATAVWLALRRRGEPEPEPEKA